MIIINVNDENLCHFFNTLKLKNSLGVSTLKMAIKFPNVKQTPQFCVKDI